MITGYAAVSLRTPTTSTTGTRCPAQVNSFGRPLNQSVRTCTSTGSTRIIAILDGSFPGASSSQGGHLGETNICSVLLDSRPNTCSMSTGRLVRGDLLTAACQLGCHNPRDRSAPLR